MFDAIVVESLLGVLVSISTFLPHAITLLRSFHISGLILRLMGFSIVRCSTLDMRLEGSHELLKGHVLSFFFLSCYANLGRLNLDLVLDIERSTTIISLKISASELEKGAVLLGWSEEAVSNMTD